MRDLVADHARRAPARSADRGAVRRIPAIVRGVVKLLEPFKVPLTRLPLVTRSRQRHRSTVSQISGELRVEDLLDRAAGRPRSRAGAAADRRPAHPRHRRRRVDRLGAVPPDRAHGARARSCSTSATKTACTRSTASCATRGPTGRSRRDRRRHRRGPPRCRCSRASAADIIFHAAAHKHVPLMEIESLRGDQEQRRSAHCASPRLRCAIGVGAFVLISTDKAVHPSSVMGATQARRRADRAAADRPTRLDALRHRALRQRARQQRQRRAALPGADQGRRAGDGDASRRSAATSC